MTRGGGGWTAVFAGRNGSPNVFQHFDSATYEAACTDAASRCLRRAPGSLAVNGSQLAVACGEAMVSFPMTDAVRDWLVSGTRAGWAPLEPSALTGGVASLPNALWTGADSKESFIFTRDQVPAATFASSYANHAGYDYCAAPSTRARWSASSIATRRSGSFPSHRGPAHRPSTRTTGTD